MVHPFLPPSTWTTPVHPPPLSSHSKKVQALIQKLRTPKQVQDWLHTLKYNSDETMYGLEGVVRRGRAHCLEGALCAAALLEYYNFPPLILDLESTDLLDHTLFLFRHQGKYGTVGMSRDIGLHGRKPVFRTIQALVQSYVVPYIDSKARLTGYGVLDLRTLPRHNWRTSKTNVWYVEEALRKIPHRKLSLSPTFVRTWRLRYSKWRRSHPNLQPDYFPGQDRWM